MADTIVTIIAVIVLFVVFPVVALGARDILRRRTRAPQSIQEARRVYEQRILRPDWSCVSRELQRPAPTALQALYRDQRLITSRDLRYSEQYSISTFEALDQPGIDDGKSWVGADAVVFATTDAGDAIHLRPGPSQGDVVYVTHHDGGDTAVFAESVRLMLSVLRGTEPPLR